MEEEQNMYFYRANITDSYNKYTLSGTLKSTSMEVYADIVDLINDTVEERSLFHGEYDVFIEIIIRI